MAAATKSVINVQTARITTYRVQLPYGNAWFAIGPVRNSDDQLDGVSFTFGSFGLALHRSVYRDHPSDREVKA